MRQRLLLALAALAVVAGGGLAWWSWGAARQERPAPPRPPVTVTAAVAAVDTWQTRLEAVGNVTPMAGVDVTSEVSGLVARIGFESGQQVQAGQLLVQLDDAVDRAHLQALEASAELARVQLRRSEQLVRSQVVSQQDLDVARAALQVARAQVAEQRAALAKKTIVAPFAGRLGLRRVNLGQLVAPGDPIVNLQALSPIYVDCSLPQQDAPRVALGQEVQVHSDAYPDEPFRGRVSAVAPGLSASSRSVQVRVKLDNSQGRLRPGMFVSADVLLPEAQAYVTLPSTALVANPYGDAVYLVQPGAAPTVKRVFVQAGPERGEQVALLSGVQAGARVVTSGQLKLQDGARVRIDQQVTLSARASPEPGQP